MGRVRATVRGETCDGGKTQIKTKGQEMILYDQKKHAAAIAKMNAAHDRADNAHTKTCVSGNQGSEWSGSLNPANPANEWICDECGAIIPA